MNANDYQLKTIHDHMSQWIEANQDYIELIKTDVAYLQSNPQILRNKAGRLSWKNLTKRIHAHRIANTH
jgi:hypothetical protein